MAYDREEDIAKVLASNPGMTRAEAEAQIDRNTALVGSGLMNPSNFTSVLGSPGVWTGKDGVAGVTALLSNPALQDKVQFGLMKNSFDTLVKTGQIVTPSTDTTAPNGQLYDAAANAGKNLISMSAGLVAAPKVLSNLSSSGLQNSLASLKDKATSTLDNIGSAVSGGVGSLGSTISGSIDSAVNLLNDPNAPPYTGDDPIIRARLGLPAVGQVGLDAFGGVGPAMVDNSGAADLGGLLANSSKFGVDTAVAWAKGAGNSALDAVNGIADGVSSSIDSITNGLQSIPGSLSGLKGSAEALAISLKPQMDSLAKQGQFAVNFSDFKLPAAVAGVVPAAGFKATVDRSTLNSAFTKLVGSAKIAVQGFSPQAIDNSTLEKAGNQAKSILSGAFPGGLDSLQGLGAGLDRGVNALGDPDAPPYTGDDPIIRARLGLPPVNELDDGDFS